MYGYMYGDRAYTCTALRAAPYWYSLLRSTYTYDSYTLYVLPECQLESVGEVHTCGNLNR